MAKTRTAGRTKTAGKRTKTRTAGRTVKKS